MNAVIRISIQNHNKKLLEAEQVEEHEWAIKIATILRYYEQALQQYRILNQQSAVEYPAGEVPENDDDLNDLSEEQKKLEETKRSIPKLRASLTA